MSSRHATALTEPPNGSRFRTRQRGCSPPSAISRPVSPRAEEIESRRRVPGDIVEALRRVGVFRMLAPHSHGGLALSVPAAVPVVEALSAADSSASWVTMIAVTSHTFCTRLPRATYDRLYERCSTFRPRITGGARSKERLTARPTCREPSGQRLDPRGLYRRRQRLLYAGRLQRRAEHVAAAAATARYPRRQATHLRARMILRHRWREPSRVPTGRSDLRTMKSPMTG